MLTTQVSELFFLIYGFPSFFIEEIGQRNVLGSFFNYKQVSVIKIFFFIWNRGGSRIFSRGADFQKIFENFDDLFFFFRSIRLIFRALPKQLKDPVLAKFSAPQSIFEKTDQKSRFWALFGKFWQKKRVFLARAPPQN